MNTKAFVSREDALEILFANRNRAYGAYQLRRQYPKVLARSLGIGILIIGLMIASPHLIKAFSSLLPEKAKVDPGDFILTEVNLELPPPPPPVIKTPPPPARALQRFVPPIVEQDDKVAEEPPKLTNDDLLNDPTEIGSKNVDGPEDVPPTIDDPGLGTVIETPVAAQSDDPVDMGSVQIPPSFPGGEAELMRYLAKNINYPNIARENNIQGLAVLSFVIGKDGSIQDVAVLKELEGGCTKEAIRVVKTMPNWRPGESNGHAVKVRFVLPVRFKLN